MTYILISTEYPFEAYGEFDTYAEADEVRKTLDMPWNWFIDEFNEEEEPFTLQEPEGDYWDEENDWREEGEFYSEPPEDYDDDWEEDFDRFCRENGGV